MKLSSLLVLLFLAIDVSLAQEISIYDLVQSFETVEKVHDTKVKTWHCSKFNFTTLQYSVLDSLEPISKDLYNVDVDFEGRITKIVWEIREMNKTVTFYPKYIDNYVLFAVNNCINYCRFMPGLLVLHRDSGHLFFVKTEMMMFPDFPVFIAPEIREIYLLSNKLFTLDSGKVYEDIFVSFSSYTHNFYIISEQFCLLEQDFVSKNKLSTRKISFPELVVLLRGKRDCDFEKIFYHQCHPKLRLWLESSRIN